MTQNYQLKTLDDTKLLAKAIAKIADRNIYLLLSGELASGKTQLTKFIGAEIGVTDVINSPSFVILNQYQTKYDWKLIHIDAYRLDKKNDFSEYFELTIDNFTIAEWPEKVNWNFDKLKTIAITFKVDSDIRNLTIATNNLTSEAEQTLFADIK
ncbi:tRNA (adenosine(37)-N6)-threonylcarbamoyltransferase complex ATPase subunit type 1 TsaE [Spiroplasma platyhelix]|uniref:tRNA threonylcarbamoyladenosine biosynthesis protein TsaE n=1 Tax=Spiroplasma platyhelix PALS-1 TaxID=1276218 RepID=A0A846U3U8_9MOLU|nr:tRNA (adenosine(37)-N6)-threonylcarbamoyltransferase complex ATPase subunit type 1 TsaE [Spiroplasma platyhelix]MBE4703784.1 tRNA threonylcarbamoyladenosine biosynthesis protein TsaE [Spiroplasma platyhelix PALS-1]NKE38157.1 tRNA (adenosine(37)-N6)-threonylcarbamoyltransferase complex ATPase subunit type 1 TsaE [Spiroplasma platyhelix PALS-1]UJB29042.1 tRNA threonylcarbamoyladenosine biosynthesis protein TsaE [Spiroplasma platyhelix PALS-1]